MAKKGPGGGRHRTRVVLERPVCPDGCGQCCDPVVLAIGPEYLAAHPEVAAVMDPREREWVENELKPVATPSWVKPGRVATATVILNGRPKVLEANYFRCVNFDSEARRCTRYEDRPRVCRDYPWPAGESPRALGGGAELPPSCVFWRDLGREPEPVPVAAPRRRT